MNYIGRKYDKREYNCAHFVSDWYRDNLNIIIPVENEFSLSFVVWMRRNFEPVKIPQDSDLVLMTTNDGSYHVGVWHKSGVVHNCGINNKHGSVIKSTLGTIRSNYVKVSFHRWSK